MVHLESVNHIKMLTVEEITMIGNLLRIFIYYQWWSCKVKV